MVQHKPNEPCQGADSGLRRFPPLHRILISKKCLQPAFWGLLAFAFFAVPDPAAGQITEITKDRILQDDSQQPWVLDADEVTYDRKLDQYVARGNVKISKADRQLTADMVRFDHKTMRAVAEGNVVLTVGQDILSGSLLEIDLENQVGFIENAYLFLRENNFRITANKIEKTGPDSYRIDRATLTTCDGQTPDWQITGKDIKIKADGSGTAKHATLWAKKIPVMYTPYFYYPATSERQSGFLAPEFGDSERRGNQYNQPFFWAISESSDATLYAHYMSKRGIKPGVEFRYVLSERTKGTLMLDGIHDKKTDDGGQSSNRYGFSDAGEQVLRTEDNRYWFRMSHHQPVPWGFFAKFDLDVASDQDYLREFQRGYMGYDDTNEYFRDAFHRQLDDYNDALRVNRLNLNRIWSKFSLNFEPRWNDDTRRDSNTRETLQRLPFFGLDGAKQKILDSPFYVDLESQYNYFWRDAGPRGNRLDIHPRFYLPFRIKNYLTVEPSVGLRETAYRLDKRQFGQGSDKDRWSHRELFDTRLELFSEIAKVFDTQGAMFEKIKHTIRPQITHEFIPDVSQDDLPNFDSIDRIQKKNQVALFLVNTLTSKSKIDEAFKTPSALADRPGAAGPKPVSHVYNDFVRFRIGQSYDFDRPKRPFSPISARLDITPHQYIRLNADAAWSVYDTEFLSHNVQAQLWDRRGDELYVDYRFAKASEEIDSDEKIQSIYGKLRLQLTDRLAISGEHEYNIESGQRIKTGAGFSYKAQCWSFDFKYTDEPNDQKLEFKINLIGLGELGN